MKESSLLVLGCLGLMANEESTPQYRVSLVYMHLRVMHFTCTAIPTSLLGPGPRLHFNSLNRVRRLQVCLLRQTGDLYTKYVTYCQNYFKHAAVLFQIVVSHLAHLAGLHLP